MQHPYAVASAFHNLPKQLQSLQLLIEQFSNADDWDERDEVLADIIEHDAPEAVVFLRIVADQPNEDVYAKCDAICGIVKRTQGQERVDALIAYLADPESVYEYCRACDTIAEVGVKAAEPALWLAWGKELEEETLLATVAALEAVGDIGDRFMRELEAMTTLETLGYERAEQMLQALANVKAPVRDRLVAWEQTLRALAAAHPDDDGEPTDLANLVRGTLLLLDANDEEE